MQYIHPYLLKWSIIVNNIGPLISFFSCFFLYFFLFSYPWILILFLHHLSLFLLFQPLILRSEALFPLSLIDSQIIGLNPSDIFLWDALFQYSDYKSVFLGFFVLPCHTSHLKKNSLTSFSIPSHLQPNFMISSNVLFTARWEPPVVWALKIISFFLHSLGISNHNSWFWEFLSSLFVVPVSQ